LSGFTRMLVIAGLIILTIAFSLLLFKEQVFHGIGNYLVIQDNLSPADIVHVVAGEDYRTVYAIDLYQQGLAKQIFFTGGVCQYHGYDHSEHGMQLARAQAVPQEALASDSTPVKSTYDEAVLLKAYLDQNPQPGRSVIVVSDPFHMRRARWTYQRVLGDEVKVMMAPVPFDRLNYRSDWWKDPAAQRYILDEYTKGIYYFLRYQLSWNWLARFDTE
jgi:uncharacterized SAM-binding protein YcdF (DUF218 family)